MLSGRVVYDRQSELLDRIDVAVADDGDEREALIEEILGGPQSIAQMPSVGTKCPLSCREVYLKQTFGERDHGRT